MARYLAWPLYDYLASMIILAFSYKHSQGFKVCMSRKVHISMHMTALLWGGHCLSVSTPSYLKQTNVLNIFRGNSLDETNDIENLYH